MHIHADRPACAGHARCQAAAENVFVLDEDGYIAADEIDVPAGSESDAQRAVLACPEQILQIVDASAHA